MKTNSKKNRERRCGVGCASTVARRKLLEQLQIRVPYENEIGATEEEEEEDDDDDALKSEWRVSAVIFQAARAGPLHLFLDFFVLLERSVGFSARALVLFRSAAGLLFLFTTFRLSCPAESSICRVARSPLASWCVLQVGFFLL